MTKAQIRDEVQKIRQAARDHDYESAHSLEDALYVAVLRFIAEGDSDNAAGYSLLALEALRAEDIEFDRHCA